MTQTDAIEACIRYHSLVSLGTNSIICGQAARKELAVLPPVPGDTVCGWGGHSCPKLFLDFPIQLLTIRHTADIVRVWGERDANAKGESKVKITVKYWVGTRQVEGTATTYRGAMRLASKNQNAYSPRFYAEDGEQLFDLGGCLVRESSADKATIEAYA